MTDSTSHMNKEALEAAARALANEDRDGWQRLTKELPETAQSYRADSEAAVCAYLAALAAHPSPAPVSSADGMSIREWVNKTLKDPGPLRAAIDEYVNTPGAGEAIEQLANSIAASMPLAPVSGEAKSPLRQALDEAEARIMQEYRWGNLTKLGVANHLRRAGFRLQVAQQMANALASPADLPAPPATMNEQDLLDLISEAIDDSMDIDWTSNIGAKSVFNRLRDEGVLRESPPATGESVTEAVRIRIAYALYGERNDPGYSLSDVADELIAVATAVLAAKPGWRLVPVEPTREMIIKGSWAPTGGPHTVGSTGARNAWEAMLAAAPTAPAGGE